MYRTICDLLPFDQDYAERSRQLSIYQKLLDGTFYDALPYEFHEERTSSGEYIPLRQRRPSVRYGLARLVVEDSVALLFSEGHFPAFDSPDPVVRDALAAVARDLKLNAIMVEAGLRGSIGSVALLLRVLRGRVFVDVLDTPYLWPQWAADAPDTLCRVVERYKVSGANLAAQGFAVSDIGGVYWFQRVWDKEFERWYEPLAVGSAGLPVEDPERTIRHGLGFVPLVWVKNLPGGGGGVDGACTFRSAIDTSIEIDYQLSQAGRGLKYRSAHNTEQRWLDDTRQRKLDGGRRKHGIGRDQRRQRKCHDGEPGQSCRGPGGLRTRHRRRHHGQRSGRFCHHPLGSAHRRGRARNQAQLRFGHGSGVARGDISPIL